MVKFKQKGSFSKTYKFLNKNAKLDFSSILSKYADEGVRALSAATPVDTGLTSNSWNYEIKKEHGKATISFHNSNIQNGVNIAIIIQYGHATKYGGWVEGRDYINPAIQKVFDRIARDAWEEVTNI